LADDPDGARERCLGDPQFLECFGQKVAGMNGLQVVVVHDAVASVVICDCHVICIAIVEPKADAPLIIDANAPLTGTVSLQLLKSVGRRQPQIIRSSGRTQLLEPHGCAFSNFHRQTAGLARSVKSLSFTVGESLNHQ
jgi:hypothetical protein